MSEPKLISPLLDNFMMGKPISDHHGVQCCPAMTKNADKRYIVKIISIPASQIHLEALLLAGAYSSKNAALSYFKELADGIAEEAEILKKLSRFEGFVPYEDLQIVEMEDGQVGYEVYLLGSYKRSLERHMQKNPMTQLQAVNLGLDLCASMVMCRRAGYLYVDLKPGNIYINEKNEYCVGDLGFVRLDSLKYASLPDKYRSAYTAPELADALASMNETVDTYAIGMILYQVYNDGKLPEDATQAPPLYADYEMADIIQKAIAADPEQRWKDPMEMGQALVAYMQRNSVNDVPIVPLPEPPVREPEPAAPPAEEPAPEVPEDAPASEPETPATPEEPIGEAPPLPEIPQPEEPESQPETPLADPETGTEDVTDLTFMDDLVNDDTAPGADSVAAADYNELSEDTSDILAQADELLAMEVLEPVVAPEPIEIPVPAPIVLADDPIEEPEPEPVPVEAPPPADPAPEESAPIDEPETPPAPAAVVIPNEPEDSDEPEEEAFTEPKKKNIVGIIALIVAIALMLGALAFGYHYYNNEYLQTIEAMEISGQEDSFTVKLTSDIDDELLTVICSDSYGNSLPASVKDGMAVFENLNADTIYKITVSIDGFHELRGKTTGTYTTPAQTNIVQFEATAGNDPGSVILTFTVEGQDTNNWTITYFADGENEKSETFSGHILAVTGLTPGKEYTFLLSGTEDLFMTGTDTVKFTISAPIYAENLAITQCTAEGITAVWTAPNNAEGILWTVRCYSDGGFDQTIETTDLTATFTGIDPSHAFTIEVTADGMTSGVMTHISARSAAIVESTGDISKPLTLIASWTFEGDAPQGGWLVTYGVDGSDTEQTVLVTEPTVSIYPAMPGDLYNFTVKAADGTTVFDNTFSYTAGPVQVFSGYGVTADNMSFRMCRTPSHSDWTWDDLYGSDYTSVFEPGEKASFVVELNTTYNISDDYIDVLFVVRNSNNEIVCTSSTGASWTFLWSGRYCELDIPTMPTEPGSYSIDIFFNGMAAARDFFEIQ